MKQSTGAHDRHIVAERDDFLRRMSHVDHRQGEIVADALQVGQDRLLARGVETGERFVEKKQSWRGDQRPRQSHPLSFAAGEVRDPSRQQGANSEHRAYMVAGKDRVGPSGPTLGEAQIAIDAEMGKQRRVLRHITDPAPLGRKGHAGGDIGQHRVVEAYPAGGRPTEPRDDFHERCFPRAGGAEESGGPRSEFCVEFQRERASAQLDAVQGECHGGGLRNNHSLRTTAVNASATEIASNPNAASSCPSRTSW